MCMYISLITSNTEHQLIMGINVELIEFNSELANCKLLTNLKDL